MEDYTLEREKRAAERKELMRRYNEFFSERMREIREGGQNPSDAAALSQIRGAIEIGKPFGRLAVLTYDADGNAIEGIVAD